MDIRFNYQDGVNTLESELEKELKNKPKKAYIFLGQSDESGIEMLDYIFTGHRISKMYVLGIDKKNTTKRALEMIFKSTKNVYVYNNNSNVEMAGQYIAFEDDKQAVVYIIGKLTKEMMTSNKLVYCKMQFNLSLTKDKLAYEDLIAIIKNGVKNKEYIKLTDEYILSLANEKEIFTLKQYTHEVMSIDDFKEQINVASKGKELVAKETAKKISKAIPLDFEIDVSSVSESNNDDSEEHQEDKLNEPSVDIVIKKTKTKKTNKKELEAMSEQEKQLEEEKVLDYDMPNDAVALEDMLFEKADVKLRVDKSNKKNKESMKKRTIDLDKVTNILLQVPDKPTRGRDITAIKIPCYIKDLIPNFFQVLEDTKSKKNEIGLAYKKAELDIDIVDVNNNQKYSSKGYMYSQENQTYVAMYIQALEDIPYEDMDIVRIIKFTDTKYHVEIVPKTTQEYEVWERLCTNEFRGSKRKYGMI